MPCNRVVITIAFFVLIITLTRFGGTFSGDLVSHAEAFEPAASTVPTPLQLNNYFYQYQGQQTDLKIEDIIRQYQPMDWPLEEGNKSHFEHSDAPIWLKVNLADFKIQQGAWFFEIAYPLLDYIDFYYVEGKELKNVYYSGTQRPHKQRPIEHNYFAFPFNVEAVDGATVYLKINTITSFTLPIKLWRPSLFYSEQRSLMLFHGLCLGSMLIMGLYNLMLYFGTRERVYIFYTGYVFCVLLFLACENGFLYEYFWSTSRTFNSSVIPILMSASVLFACLFCSEFLELQTKSPKLSKIIYGVAAYALTPLVFLLFVDLDVVAGISNMVIFVACIIGTVIVGVRALDKDLMARLFLFCWSFILVALPFIALNQIGFIGNNFYTENALQLSCLLESVLLSFALSQKIKLDRREKHTAIRRNQDLEKSNDELVQLSNLDGLTGIYNRRSFDAHSVLSFRLARHQQNSIATLLIDIDHFKQINDFYGHQMGDACLCKIADVLRTCLSREYDVLARYGGEEFVVLLPNVDIHGAKHVAEKMRNAVESTEIKFGTEAVHLTISIGVSVVTPETGYSIPNALKWADQKLYAAKNGGRNRVKWAA